MQQPEIIANELLYEKIKEDYDECIDINTQHNDITALVVNNINHPETLLVDRKILLNLLKNGYNSWKDIFYLKY